MEAEAGIRGDMLALINRLLHRVQVTASSNQKESLSHAKFRTWILEFVLSELRAEAGYQRHIAALKVLESIFLLDDNKKSKDKRSSSPLQRIPSFAEPYRKIVQHTLADMIWNAFDDIRELSTRLLLPTLVEEDVNQVFEAVTAASSKLRSSGRADDADSFGCLFWVLVSHVNNALKGSDNLKGMSKLGYIDLLLSWLEGDLVKAQSDLLSAIQDSPLHGYLIALRSVFSAHLVQRALIMNQIRF
jgi:hypothetical protein